MSPVKLLLAMPTPAVDTSALSPNSSSLPVTTNSSLASPPLNSPPLTPTNISSKTGATQSPGPVPSKKPPAPPVPIPSSSKAPPKSPNLLPPPAAKHRPAPSNTTLTPGNDGGSTPSSGERHISMSLVLGVAAGVGILVVLMIIASVCCSTKEKKKKKKNHNHNPMRYYVDGSMRKGGGGGGGGGGGDYYTSGPASDWHDGPDTMDHNHNMKAQPPSLHPPVGGWHPPMASGEMSTTVYSGPHVPPMPPPSPTIALGFNKSTFTYEELASATSNFSQVNLLGQGGFGYVHKGVLPNGKEIAVKQLKAGSGQGEREFQAEVDIISRVHHRHLVSLVGYCIAGTQRLLVYEFVPNKTLEYHLHAKGLTPMDWPTRLKIALGSAKGIAYLHEDCHPRIIHRDIKSANILLDLRFEAMVADFGLAKLTSDNHTHVSTRVMGTFGYLAPEYASSGKLTEKSDVFSYGVMLLELITGKRPVDTHTFIEDSLVDWARPVLSRALADGDYDELADIRLDGNYDLMEMARMVACAAACVRHSARRRPKMSQIVRALEGDVSLEDLNEGMRPGQSMLFSSGSDYENNSYTTNMRRVRRVALASPEYSAEYSGPMPDYGLHPSASSSDFSGELNPIGDQRHRAHPPL